MLIRGILAAAGTAAVVVAERSLGGAHARVVAHGHVMARPDGDVRLIVGVVFALPFLALIAWATARESRAKAKAAQPVRRASYASFGQQGRRR
jgi:hypothetical protein